MTNIKHLINLEPVQVLHRALGTDADLHIVGGACRDAALGREPKDIDLATKLRPDEVERRLTLANIPFVVTGLRRGTITALVDSEPVEITTFRNPANEKEFTDSILDDLPARDFTINAIAISANTGHIVDPFDGLGDLKRRHLRTAGDPERRFKEDPHRILRMVRFGAGRKIGPVTLGTALELSPLLKNISMERIHDEFCKIMVLPKEEIGAAMRLLHNLGFFQMFIPELWACKRVEQNKFHSKDVFGHIMDVVQAAPADKLVRIAALLHDIGKPLCRTVNENGEVHFLRHEDIGAAMAVEALLRMKFSREDIQAIRFLVSEHMRDITMGPKGIRRLIKEAGDLLPRWLMLKKADSESHRRGIRLGKWTDFEAAVKFELNRKEEVKFDVIAINGHDVMSLGFKQGKIIGEILKACSDLVLDDPKKNTKEFLITFVRSEFCK